MTSATLTAFGIAKQTAKGTAAAITKFMPFISAAGSPQNVIVPLDLEAGGSPLIRSLIKAGVSSAGAIEFVPRPTSILTLMACALGQDSASTVVSGTAYKHVVKMNADPFDIPYMTMNPNPGNMWGEQFQDCRITALGLSWKAPGFVRGAVGFIGGLPSKVATPLPATVAAGIDFGAPFITPTASIELPLTASVKVLAGSFSISNSIPMDEQWITGSYTPDAFDVVARSISIQFAVKITDAGLYSRMMYDPAGGAAWVASLFKEGSFRLEFKTEKTIGTTGLPYQLNVKCDNGTHEIETATLVLTTGAITTAGNVLVTVTVAGMAGSPKAYNVPVLLGDTTLMVAEKIRAFLAADAVLTVLYAVGASVGSNGVAGTGITLTANASAADDATVNIAIAPGTSVGPVAAPTSVATAAGVLGAAPNNVDNIVWTCDPIGLRAGKNVIMSVTGTFLASATDILTVELVNDIVATV